jgi:hypothetical protein
MAKMSGALDTFEGMLFEEGTIFGVLKEAKNNGKIRNFPSVGLSNR